MTAWVKEIREDELAPVPMMAYGTWKRYVSLEEDGRGMIFGLGRLEPGEEVEHAHVEEELFYVLKGRGEAIWEVDGQTHRAQLRPGVAPQCPQARQRYAEKQAREDNVNQEARQVGPAGRPARRQRPAKPLKTLEHHQTNKAADYAGRQKKPLEQPNPHPQKMPHSQEQTQPDE